MDKVFVVYEVHEDYTSENICVAFDEEVAKAKVKQLIELFQNELYGYEPIEVIK